jgi:membrane fusion protein (multidrug efflux system)
VRIALDPQQLAAHPLRIGLSTHASVDVRDDSGTQLALTARQQPILATRAFDIDKREVAARIEKIVSENSPPAADKATSGKLAHTGRSARRAQTSGQPDAVPASSAGTPEKSAALRSRKPAG